MADRFDPASAHGGTPLAGPLTRDELQRIYPRVEQDLRSGRVAPAVVDARLAALNEAWRLLGIDTVQAQAGFLAHAAVESDQFRKLTETQSWRQDWEADPTRIRLDTRWLDEAAAQPRYRAYAMGGSINPHRDASWQSAYIGRGPLQVTHEQGYARVVAHLREAARRLARAGDAAAGTRLEQAAQAVADDPRQAASVTHGFLFSAAFMKELEGHRLMATVVPGAPFGGSGAESRWMTGGATELPDRAAGKSQAYQRAHAALSRRAVARAQELEAVRELGAELDELVGAAQRWQAHAAALEAELVQALERLGEIDLPIPATPPRGRQLLGSLSSLYLVHELEPLMRAAERVASLWASGAITVPLPRLEPQLAKSWRERRLKLSGDERRNLLALAFGAEDFLPALARLCRALAALADNRGESDLREAVAVQQAAQAVLELAAARLEGVLQAAGPELLAQLRQATQLLADRSLQAAFGVPDLPSLVRACLVTEPALAAGLRGRIERARAGAAVLQWLATQAAGGFAVDPRDAALPAVMAAAERWTLAGEPAAARAAPSPAAYA